MTLKDYYEETKKKKISITIWIFAILSVFGLCAFYTYLIYFGWHNIISKVFNFPDITYAQTAGILVWALLIKLIFRNKL